MHRILLIEDETTSRAIIGTQLRNVGYTVDEADDGKTAWETLQEIPDYSVVVTDRRMPNMDGVRLCQLMKAAPSLRHIPVILQTAANSPDEVEEGIRSGAYYYLAKPFREETLLALVKSAIRDRRKEETLVANLSKQRNALHSFDNGIFYIRTLEEARNLAFLLAELFPRPDVASAGLFEFLINAIEHGNLGIGLEEKNRLLWESQWEDEVWRRLERPENAAKRVKVEFTQRETQLEVTITDEGAGFDWRPFLEIEPSRATDVNGRGIAIANLLGFDRLSYLGAGNKVHIITRRGDDDFQNLGFALRRRLQQS